MLLFLQQAAAALGLAAERVFGKATWHSAEQKDTEKKRLCNVRR
jgi:hypothetical protein